MNVSSEDGVIRDEIPDDRIMAALASLLHETTVDDFFLKTLKQQRHRLSEKRLTGEGKKCAEEDPAAENAHRVKLDALCHLNLCLDVM